MVKNFQEITSMRNFQAFEVEGTEEKTLKRLQEFFRNL